MGGDRTETLPWQNVSVSSAQAHGLRPASLLSQTGALMGYGTQLAEAQPHQAELGLWRACTSARPALAEPAAAGSNTAGTRDAVFPHGYMPVKGEGPQAELSFLVVLALQATLSVQPVSIRTASQDDGTHSWAGQADFVVTLFAMQSPALRLGACATRETKSLLLLVLALAIWWAARAHGEVTGGTAAAWLPLSLVSTTVLIGRVVIPVTVVAAWTAGRRVAAQRASSSLIVTAALVIAGLRISAASYLTVIKQTTLERVTGTNPWLSRLSRLWFWSGVTLALAVSAAFSNWVTRQARHHTSLLAVRTVVAPLGSGEQGIPHTTHALSKHIDLGTWFAAISANRNQCASLVFTAGRLSCLRQRSWA